MMFRSLLAAILVSLTLGTVARAEATADFPPGMFTDTGRYSIEQMRGKVVVLFFFEETCPRCRGLIPERNKLINSMRDKPVKFIAVDPGHTLADSNLYAQETKFIMPIFSDPLRVMEARWHEHISLNNIYQFKVIDSEGHVAAFREEDIAAVVAKASWKFKGKGYDAKLDNAIEAFEWNQYAIGMRLLRPSLKASNKAVLEDALKLYTEVKTEGEQWKADADKAVEENPVEAYDLYVRVSEVFGTDELGKSVAEPLKKLKTNKAVKDELAARGMYDQVSLVMGKATLQQKGQVAQYCQSIAKKYPQTPTGKRAAALATELGSAGASAPETILPDGVPVKLASR
jgi:thiol-disulfide isomerase/thioredoxin